MNSLEAAIKEAGVADRVCRVIQFRDRGIVRALRAYPEVVVHDLLDLEQLDVELQGAVGGDAGKTLGAVGKAGGDGQTTLAADSHALDADVPALDDLALASLEGEGLALLVGCGGELALI